MMKNIINDPLTYIFEQFKKNNFQIYLVGGCVRDAYLGLEPQDFDLTTDALPDQILALFPQDKTLEIGKKYGTIGLVLQGKIYEITSFRRDQAYVDGRRPQGVEFTSSLKEDLSRRDFTINALAMDPEGQLIDYFKGLEDLDQKILRSVGPAKERFQEDHLRILRALRFASCLDLTIEESTAQAIHSQAASLAQLAPERIQGEFNKILLGPRPSQGLKDLVQYGLMAYIIPELLTTVDYDQRSPYHERRLFDHLTCVVDQVPAKLPLRLAALLHDLAKPACLTIDEKGQGHFYEHDRLGAQEAKTILRRLNYSKKTIHQVETLIAYHMRADPQMKVKGLKRLINRVGPDLIFDLMDLMIADRACTRAGRDLDFLYQRKEEVAKILAAKLPLSSQELAINGHDVLQAGWAPGPQVGQVLKHLTDLVLDDPSLNEREFLLAQLDQWKKDKNML